MTAKDRRRIMRWERYIMRTSRGSMHHAYPFGLTIKITPGYFGHRRVMRYRGGGWYLTRRMTKEMFRENV